MSDLHGQCMIEDDLNTCHYLLFEQCCSPAGICCRTEFQGQILSGQTDGEQESAARVSSESQCWIVLLIPHLAWLWLIRLWGWLRLHTCGAWTTRTFQTMNTSDIMILYTRSTPTTNVPFLSIYLYSNLCPFNLKYVGDKVTKKMMKRVAGRVELSERAVMIFHVVCKYTHTTSSGPTVPRKKKKP